MVSRLGGTLIIIQNTFISFNTKVYQIKHFISIKNVSLGHFRISQEERQWRSVSQRDIFVDGFNHLRLFSALFK